MVFNTDMQFTVLTLPRLLCCKYLFPLVWMTVSVTDITPDIEVKTKGGFYYVQHSQEHLKSPLRGTKHVINGL